MDRLGPNGKVQKKLATLRGGPLYSVGLVQVLSNLTVPFDVFSKIFNPSTSLFFTFHWCYRLVKNGLFPERVSYNLFVIQTWCLKIFELNQHISISGSPQNNLGKISTHEAVHTISLIKSNLSFNSNTRMRMEWNETFRTRHYPFAPKKFSNLSPGILVEWIVPNTCMSKETQVIE